MSPSPTVAIPNADPRSVEPQVVETPSGKTAEDENFPVGSFLIRPDLRAHVHVFYDFARSGDDVADNPDLAPEEKVARLALMAKVIRGEGDTADEAATPNAARMRRNLVETGITPQHCLDLLQAFTQDAQKLRYRDWDDLVGYCYLSAAPVGRHLLDLHGESKGVLDASDALCNALQVINHLQDCGLDYRNLDRVYLPTGTLEAEGAAISDLGGAALTPPLRHAIDRLIPPLRALLDRCRDLVVEVRDPRLALECAVIRRLAVRLTERLAKEDPLATRVVLSKPAMATLSASAVAGGLLRRLVAPGRRHR